MSPSGAARRWAVRVVVAVERRPAWLVLVIAAPLGLALARIHGTSWHLARDLSHTELMVRSIPDHPPLVGVVGRFGTPEQPGAHPGPSMAYALYPLYKGFGSTSWALMAGTTVLHVAAIAVAVLVARRVGGRQAALVVALVAAVLVRALGVEWFATPWNVWLPFFAFVTFFVMVWGVAGGDLRLAPWAVLVGSHAAQTHISYLPLVVGLLGAALVWLAVCARWPGVGAPERPVRWVGLARATGWSALVGLAAWLPPILDQVRHDPGNLRILYHHFTDPPSDPVGVGDGLRGFFGEFDLFGTWWRGGVHQPTDRPFWPGVAAMVILAVVGAVVAARRRDRLVVRLQGVVGAALLIGMVAVTRIVGDFYDYVIRWLWALSALTVGASVWAIARAVGDAGWTPERRRVVRRVGVAAAGALLVVPVTLTTADAFGTDGPTPRDSALVGSLAAESETGLGRDGRYLVRWHDPVTLSGGAFGLLLQWEKDGYRVGVDPWWGLAAQGWRVVDEAVVDEVLWFVTGDPAIAVMRGLGWRELGVVDVRTADERAESDGLRARILARFGEIGRPDLATVLDAQYGVYQLLLFQDLPGGVVEDLTRYRDLLLPAAVFAAPACAVLDPMAPVGDTNPEVREDCLERRAALRPDLSGRVAAGG